jgi:hypothetical protein
VCLTQSQSAKELPCRGGVYPRVADDRGRHGRAEEADSDCFLVHVITKGHEESDCFLVNACRVNKNDVISHVKKDV